jgi:hypothetical protein
MLFNFYSYLEMLNLLLLAVGRMYGETSIEGLELINGRLDSSVSLLMTEAGALTKSKT